MSYAFSFSDASYISTAHVNATVSCYSIPSVWSRTVTSGTRLLV